MDVLTSETYWALNNETIKQVTSSWSLFIHLSHEMFVFHKIQFEKILGHNLQTDKREISAYLNIAVTKAIPLHARTSLEGSRSFRLIEFLDIRHTKVVRLSALCSGRLYPQKISLVLIYVGGWVDPLVIVRSKGVSWWKIPMTRWEIDPATFRLVAQASTNCITAYPSLKIWSA